MMLPSQQRQLNLLLESLFELQLFFWAVLKLMLTFKLMLLLRLVLVLGLGSVLITHRLGSELKPEDQQLHLLKLIIELKLRLQLLPRLKLKLMHKQQDQFLQALHHQLEQQQGLAEQPQV